MMILRIFARTIDAILGALAPIENRAWDHLLMRRDGADELTEAEAEMECYEPDCLLSAPRWDSKYRIYKENAGLVAETPECGPAMWLVLTPDDEEFLFSTYQTALRFVASELANP